MACRKTDAVDQQQPAALPRRAEDVPLPPVAPPQTGDRRAGGAGIVLPGGPSLDTPNPTTTPT